jgi:hypothetical protein
MAKKKKSSSKKRMLKDKKATKGRNKPKKGMSY